MIDATATILSIIVIGVFLLVNHLITRIIEKLEKRLEDDNDGTRTSKRIENK